MNRAIATIKRLEQIQIEQLPKPIGKMKPPQRRNKAYNEMFTVEIKFKLPRRWKTKLQTKADNKTKGNLSKLLRQIVEKEIQQ